MEKIKEYAFTTVLSTSYENAISKVTDALKEEGFGVLTEIDVKATLKKKLGVDFRKYVILIHPTPIGPFRPISMWGSSFRAM
jgi:uncharacterized protein (DUF302 family)